MSEVSETGESILKDNTRQDEEIEIDKRDHKKHISRGHR
jgi:hypothetical protein